MLLFPFSILKVQKSEMRKNEWKYFVHYLGWSKTLLFLFTFLECVQKWLLKCSYVGNSWDEWVSAERLMKYTPENILEQQALDKKHGVDRNPKSGRSNQTKPKIANDSKVDKEDVKSNESGIEFHETLTLTNLPPRKRLVGWAKGRKRKTDSSTEKEIASITKLVNIEIPSTLKKQLVDDWEFVNEQDKLVKLPRSPNVDDILDSYLEYMSKKDDMMTDSIGEIMKGLRCYFDRALPVILLYNKERQQYRESVTDDASPSSIYGAEHLLRLFGKTNYLVLIGFHRGSTNDLMRSLVHAVKLPELLPYLNIEDDMLVQLQQKFLDFLRFLQKKQSSFFISSYDDDSKVSEASSAGRTKTSRD
ncbi:hypothetical protein OSB04_027267 [Centaurea solstitialis]|uniref:MRG domain-containing protein n=1 Tax=Centaurea solstitialis TaxID=347529 RepID=A0AA38SQI9_9ASTR|nr:hypothetical protein OSB04_027267 [Centaurea solstitialis]